MTGCLKSNFRCDYCGETNPEYEYFYFTKGPWKNGVLCYDCKCDTEAVALMMKIIKGEKKDEKDNE